MISSHLTIKNLKLAVFLGWPEQERLREQTVMVDIDIYFSIPPKACESDCLDDTFCYHQLTNLIREKTRERHFHLVEHLTHAIFQVVKPYLPQETRLTVSVTKYPRIEDLEGGVCFRYGNST